jgi:uncharacterized protein YjdB
MSFKNLVKETTTTTGTGPFVRGGAVDGFRAFTPAYAIGEVARYCCRMGTQYEFGSGKVSATTIERGNVTDSSNGGALVPFTAGTKELYVAVDADLLNGETIGDLATAPSIPDTYVMELFDPATGSSLKATVAALRAIFGGTAPAPATVTTVTVSPSAPSVTGGATQTFTATVTGTNSPAQTVTWTASAGSITAGGVFTAPAATASAQTITITARSTVDTTKTGTATVTVAATGTPAPTVSGVTVSPSTATVAGSGTQQFSATVAGTNSPSQSVTWTANAGTINSSGLFTAPSATGSSQTITITATSAADASKSGTATVTIAAVAMTAYTITGYGSPANAVKSSYSTTTSGTEANANLADRKGYTYVKLCASQYWTITPTPATATTLSGWGDSSTVPPAEVTVAQNTTYSGTNGINGLIPMTKPGAFSDNSWCWIPNSPGTYSRSLWIRPDGGVAQCVGTINITVT